MCLLPAVFLSSDAEENIKQCLFSSTHMLKVLAMKEELVTSYALGFPNFKNVVNAIEREGADQV